MPKKTTDINNNLDKYRLLDKALSSIPSDFYKGIGIDKNVSVEFIPTDCLSFDASFKGIAKGRIYEVFGPQGAGKTTVSYLMASSVQRAGGKVMWVDVEGVHTDEYAEACGFNTSEAIIIGPDTMNDCLEACRIAVNSGAIDLVVVDSVAAMVPQDEFDKDIGGGMIGTRARLMSSSLPQLVKYCKKSKCSMIFINQERSSNMTG